MRRRRGGGARRVGGSRLAVTLLLLSARAIAQEPAPPSPVPAQVPPAGPAPQTDPSAPASGPSPAAGQAPAVEDVSASPAPAAKGARAPSTPPVQDVQVHGKKATRASQTSMAARELREVPGAFGDAFRVIETLPGVTPLVSGLPYFFVRGAPPGNNGYYLDGVRVPLLYHIGAGPSVVHPALIERVDFYPGGYPARYGRYVGGILAAETRPPASELHGQGTMRLYDSGALVEAPFGDGRGSVLASGRYSYTGAIISIAAPDTKLDYWDYQGRVTWDLGPYDTIGLFAFGSYDFLGQRRKDGHVESILDTQFHRLDARWDHALPAGGRMRIGLTAGVDETATEDFQGVRDRMLAARLILEQPAGRNVVVRAGLDTTFDHYDLQGDADVAKATWYPPRSEVVSGAYLEAAIRATPRWEVTPGFRVDYFSSVRSLETASREDQHTQQNAAVPALDPRLLSRLRLTGSVALVSTFALTHQPPAFFIPVPGLQLGRLAAGLQTGVQMSQGAEIALPEGFTFSPTFFYHHYIGLSDFTTTCGEVSDASESTDECIDRRVRGRSLGVEMLLRRSLTRKLTGWISYTLSRTTRATQVTVLAQRGQYAEIPGDFDRTHVLNVIGAYDLGRGWRIGARLFYYTGRPYSDRVYDVPVPPYNDRRLPDFYRIDGRIEKVWRVGTAGRLSLIFEWLNMTLRKEAVSVECKPPLGAVPPSSFGGLGLGKNTTLDTCTPTEIGPVTIPSIGVEGQF